MLTEGIEFACMDDAVGKVVFVSFPYSHQSKDITQWRMRMFRKYAGQLLTQGIHVVSPMSMLDVVTSTGKDVNWNTWQAYCESILLKCDELWILDLPGWDKSDGVQGEIKFAKAHRIPVSLVVTEEHEPAVENCPECHAPLNCARGGGVVCSARCGYWFCY